MEAESTVYCCEDSVTGVSAGWLWKLEATGRKMTKLRTRVKFTIKQWQKLIKAFFAQILK